MVAKKADMQTYVTYYPLDAISIENDMNFGNVEILMFSGLHARELKNRAWKTLRERIDPQAMSDEQVERMFQSTAGTIDQLSGSICAKVDIDGDFLTSFQTTRSKVIELLALLNFFYSAYRQSIKIDNMTIAGEYSFNDDAPDPVICGDRVIRISRGQRKKVGNLLDEKFFEYADSNGFEELDKLRLASNNRGKTHPVLIIIHWFYEGCCTSDKHSALLNFFAIPEILFGPQKNASLTANISEGTALLLGINDEHRVRIKKRMGELYELRSKYVHEGICEYDWAVVNEMREISRRLIEEYIQRYMNNMSFDDFRVVVKRMKISNTIIDSKLATETKASTLKEMWITLIELIDKGIIKDVLWLALTFIGSQVKTLEPNNIRKDKIVQAGENVKIESVRIGPNLNARGGFTIHCKCIHQKLNTSFECPIYMLELI